MNRTSLKAFAATLLLSLVSVAIAGNADDPLKEISGYREWVRVNQKPIEVSNSRGGVS